jgi:hypothetical protein
MRMILAAGAIIGSILLSLVCQGCSEQEATGRSYSIEGKWRGEKKDVDKLIGKIRSENEGMPENLIEPMIAKLRTGANITEDWQFNADGTGRFDEKTGKELCPITWIAGKKNGSKWQITVDFNPNDPSPMKIDFLINEKMIIFWLDEDGTESGYRKTYQRPR